MTEREIADRIRATLTVHSDLDLWRLADELDPPRPKPGTVVWWRWTNRKCERGWSIGQVADNGRGVCIDIYSFKVSAEWRYIEWKPARIAGPMQEIVDIPPVSEWPDDVGSITQRMIPHRSRTSHTIITRDEAARREAKG